MTIAWLFPGQGTDLAAVAGAWHAASEAVRRGVALAESQCGIPAVQLLHGNGLALRDTRAYQPTLVAVCVGLLHEAERRLGAPRFVAGHSLGEIPACVAAGAIAGESAIALAAIRGRLMARESLRHPGTMVALRTDPEGAHDALALAAAAGPAAIAAHNAPDEQVLSGSREALRAIPARFARTPLATDGAWHSPAMAGAVEEYRAALGAVCTAPARVALLANRTGGVVPPDADVVPLLAEQLTHPVQWLRTLEELRTRGVRTFVTLGPARALRSLARRTLGDSVTVLAIEHPDDLSRAEEALAA